MILNKSDLLPHVQFDTEKGLDYARQVNPNLQTLRPSATGGDGLPAWYTWLRQQMLSATGCPTSSRSRFSVSVSGCPTPRIRIT